MMTNVLDEIRDSVFFTTYGGGHAAALAPVYAKLLNADVKAHALALTTAKAHFERSGLPAIGMRDLYADVPSYELAADIGRALAAQLSSHAAVSLDEAAAYLGVGYQASVSALGEAGARAQYERLGRQGFCPVDFFKRMFTVSRPAVVVATSAPRFERAALEAAAALGIPSLCLVDLYAPFEIEWCGAPNYASIICVLNEAVAARFRDHGVPGDRVAVTGNPAFDRLGSIDIAYERARHRGAWNLSDEDRLIAWISQPEPARHPFSGVEGDPDLPLVIEQHLAKCFVDDPHVHLVMRLHPSEDRPPAASGARIRYSNSGEPLDALLCAADCVVTCSSTVGLEAAMIGIPVVQFMDSIFSPDLPLGKLGLARSVPSHYEAASAISECLRLSGRPKPAVQTLENDFNAATNVAIQILTLLKQSNDRESNDEQ